MENQKSSPHQKTWYAPLVHFLAHTVVGSGIFIIIATPSVFLGWLVHKLREYHVAEFTLSVLTFLEHAILVVDALTFLSFLGFTSWAAVKEMKQNGH
ncbi:hypothetical protein KBJ94_23050 [Pseudomonas sp. ITA]|uniref:hypothetical protein n=1 Tax=Pseudomonas sp. ITA TaxID=2825841 RepID=UPI0024986230|nr:hypothetical protein [Pseudomonas sp. ITA]MDI2144930.1 hypothetical protein [Pseudomonas sp. ITA]